MNMKKIVIFSIITFSFAICNAEQLPCRTASTVSSATALASGDTLPFFVPNAFTPNSDGLNETFHLKYEIEPFATFSFFQMMIYDRYGKLLFKSNINNPMAEWDGTDKNGTACPAGVYVCIIKYRLRNAEEGGSVGKGDYMVYKHTFALLR